MSDEELLAAWRAGDREAGSELFERYFDALHRFFCNKVDGAAEDLIQTVFLAICEGAERIEKFRPYLYGVARKLLLVHYRKRRPHAPEVDIEELSVIDLGASPTSRLARDENDRVVLEALRRLSLDDQTLLELRFWEGATAPELATLFDIPVNTASTRLRRARLRLEQQIAAVQGGPALDSTLTGLDQWAESLRMHLLVGARSPQKV